MTSTGARAGVMTTLAAEPAGLCAATGAACATDSNWCATGAPCPDGTCFLRPGGCILDLGTACDPTIPGACPEAQLWQPIPDSPGRGTCREVHGGCRNTADRTAPAFCNAGTQAFNRLVGPLVKRTGDTTVFTGAGHFVEDPGTICVTTADCAPGTFCDGGGSASQHSQPTCHREHGVCSREVDCPGHPVNHCEPDLLVHALESVTMVENRLRASAVAGQIGATTRDWLLALTVPLRKHLGASVQASR